MTEPPPTAPATWPPIIRDAALPRGVLWRDRICTAAMWLLLLWLCRAGFRSLFEVSRDLLRDGELHFRDLFENLIHLRHYFETIGLLALWLSAWTAVTLRRRDRYLHLPQPAPLTLRDVVVEIAGTEADLSGWRKLKVCVVHLVPPGKVSVLPKQAGDN